MVLHICHAVVVDVLVIGAMINHNIIWETLFISKALKETLI